MNNGHPINQRPTFSNVVQTKSQEFLVFLILSKNMKECLLQGYNQILLHPKLIGHFVSNSIYINLHFCILVYVSA